MDAQRINLSTIGFGSGSIVQRNSNPMKYIHQFLSITKCLNALHNSNQYKIVIMYVVHSASSFFHSKNESNILSPLMKQMPGTRSKDSAMIIYRPFQRRFPSKWSRVWNERFNSWTRKQALRWISSILYRKAWKYEEKNTISFNHVMRCSTLCIETFALITIMIILLMMITQLVLIIMMLLVVGVLWSILRI